MFATRVNDHSRRSDTIYSVNGPTVNPWSTAQKKYVAGGSSGGSAVAVASHTCYGALGSDTGGSVRLPASFTGLVGLKPSYGRTSRHGLIAYGSSLDCPALFSKTVQDSAILLDVIAGEDPLDSTSVLAPAKAQFENNLKNVKDLRGVRVGIPSEYNVAELSDEIRQYWKDGADWLKSHGAELVEVSLPNTKLALSAYYIIAPAEASSNLARYDGVRYGHRTQEDCATIKDMITKSRTEGFGSEVQRRIIIGTFALSRKSYESYYKKALEIRRLVLNDFHAVFRSKENPSGVDVLLTPTAPSSAGELNNALEKTKQNPVDLYLMDVMTIPANMAGKLLLSVRTALVSFPSAL
jgi:aspartyl-tRNA(Asn)/glutamyl-tRNA(Gln) amidotransferase subunit A